MSSQDNVPVNRKRTKIEGRTRVNPEVPFKRKDRSMKRKLQRLINKVKRITSSAEAPPVALVSITNGVVNLTGNAILCEALWGLKGKELLEIAQPVVQSQAVQQIQGKSEKTVSLKKINPTINWEETSVPVLRQAYAQICQIDGDTSANRYSGSKQPEFWPADIPFCSHSKRKEGGGRVLSKQDMQVVLSNFADYCLAKIAEGHVPVDIPSSISKEELQQLAEATYQMDEDHSHVLDEVTASFCQFECEEPEQNEEIPCPDEQHQEPGSMEEADDVQGTEKDPLTVALEKNDFSHAKRVLQDMKSLSREHITLIKEAIGDHALQVQYIPQKARRYKGPARYTPGRDAIDVWHLLHLLPDVARLLVYVFAVEHVRHYCSQYEDSNTCIDTLKAALNNFGDGETVEEVLEEEARHLLTDAVPNSACWMFLAGALGKEISVFHENGTRTSFPPCPCESTDRDVERFYVDSRSRVYPLSEKRIWRASKVNTRTTDNVMESQEEDLTDSSHSSLLPGMTDGPVFHCYGYEVWRGEIERVRKGEWLDDSVVNVLLRHGKEGHSDVLLFDSTFAKDYFVPKEKKDSNRKLPMTAANLSAVSKYTRRVDLNPLRLLLFPICDNTHWYLGAFFPRSFKLCLCCSLGRKPRLVAESLKRYCAHIYQCTENIQIEFPNVPRQTNGSDCGVFTIEYGLNLMEVLYIVFVGQQLFGDLPVGFHSGVLFAEKLLRQELINITKRDPTGTNLDPLLTRNVKQGYQFTGYLIRFKAKPHGDLSFSSDSSRQMTQVFQRAPF